MRASEAGQSTLLAAAIVAMVAVTALLVGVLGNVASDRAAARTAADAAALAGATGGEQPARQAAQRNGGELEELVLSADAAESTVRVGRARASARAERHIRVAGSVADEVAFNVRPGL